MSAVLVTGAAGFIGHRLCMELLTRGERVIGIDNFSDYYAPSFKSRRLEEVSRVGKDHFSFVPLDLTQPNALANMLTDQGRDVSKVVHLAAQAGVRWSKDCPQAYVDANVSGHLSVLEAVRRHRDMISHTLYASSSSVYGNRNEGPFRETDVLSDPASLYAATKIHGELISKIYSEMYGLSLTGLRFFTAYGPWGRPDMAYWIFTKALLQGKEIRLFNEGDMERDFTFVDDIVLGILAILGATTSGHRVYNLGNNRPERLLTLVRTLEDLTGTQANLTMLPMQSGDVRTTFADISAMTRDFGWKPETSLATGLERFVRWYKEFFGDSADALVVKGDS